MKLLVTIIQQDDLKDVVDNLLSRGHRVTKLKSVGGFLEVSNIVLLIGVETEKVEDVLRLGDHIQVKVIEIGDDGKIRLSRKALLKDGKKDK